MANLPEVGLQAVIANLGGFEAGAKAIVNAYNQIEKETNNVVRASATLRDAEGNLARFSVVSGQTSQAVQQAGMSFQQAIGKVASFAVALGVTRKLQQFTTESFTAARAQNDVRNALIQTVGSVEEYSRLIASAQESTRGMVSETRLAQAGLVFLKSGIAGSSEEVGRLSAAGTALVNTYSNLGATQEKLIRFILTGNRALVDNFNLTQQQINAKTAEVEATTNLEGAEAKLEARKLLIIETGERLLTTVSNETIQIQAAQAAWENFEAAFGQVLIVLNQATGTVPAVTTLFNNLTEGAKAWSVILGENIPAIQEHNASLIDTAAKNALAAKSQEEFQVAVSAGMADFQGFKTSLIENASSYEEFLSAAQRATEGNVMAQKAMVITREEFEAFKSAQEAARQAQADAVVTSGIWVSSVEAMNITAVDATTIQQALAQAISDTASAQQVAALGFGEMTNRQREAMAAMALARGQTPELQSAFSLKEDERRRKERENAAKELERQQESLAKKMQKSFEDAARNIVSTIESVLQPTLDEVWTPPEGSEVRFDEAARQLATVATSGFGSEWLTTLATQFGGQDFFQPVIAAMEAGDPEALKNAATSILTNNVTQLWDVEVIKQKVRDTLQQQNLRQQIIDQVKEELNLEGTEVGPDAISPITDGLSDIVTSVPPAGASLTTLATDAGTGQTALDTLGQSLNDLSAIELPGVITKTDELTKAVREKLTQAWNNSLIPAMRKVSDFITKNLLVDLESVRQVITEKVGVGISDLSETTLPDLVTGLEEVDTAIKNALSSFRELSREVDNFSLPDVLQPGSPPPMAIALTDIANAAGLATQEMAGLANAASSGNFDQLLGIDRTITDPLRIAGAAFDDLEKHLDRILGGGKGKVALDLIKPIIKGNLAGIMASANPMAAIQNLLKTSGINFEKLGLGGLFGDKGGVGNVFWASFMENMDEAKAALQEMFIEAGRTAVTIGQRLTGVIGGAVDVLNSRVERLQGLVAAGGGQFEGRILDAVQAQQLLNEALEEQAAIQDDILATKENEQKLNFLQQQLDLFDTIKAAGLDVGDVLGGLTLGLDASIPDLIAATNAVIEAMINQVNADLGTITGTGADIGDALIDGAASSLGISSPSKVMKALADNTMGSFLNQMLSWGPAIASAGAQAIAGPSLVAAPAMAGAGGSQTTINANFGGNSISSGMDEAQFDSMVLRSIQRLMR